MQLPGNYLVHVKQLELSATGVPHLGYLPACNPRDAPLRGALSL